MKINKYWFWEAPQKLNGPVVAVDIWAATTNLSIMLKRKVKRIILANENNYQTILNKYPKSLFIGESNFLSEDKFYTSNRPSDIAKTYLKNRKVVFMTINGTRVFEKYKKQKIIIAGSFVNLKSVAKFLRKYQRINIILAGDKPNKVLEDEIFGQLIIKEIKKQHYDWTFYKQKAQQFVRKYYQWSESAELLSLPYVFSLSKYEIIPAGFVNKEGFLEIKNLLS
jgi:phosphosulfolactate phosphohydrolase-like enzyme